MSRSDSETIGGWRRLDALLELWIWWAHSPLVRWIERWRRRGRDRRTLAGLDDRALRDLGLDRADVETESTQSFWRRR